MDLQFASKLQTAMQNLGRTNGFAPPKSQDSADPALHELFVAETGRSLFDKRKKAALDAVKAHVKPDTIEAHLKAADKGTTGTYVLVDTENYTCTLTIKSPSERLDKSKLIVELVKLGVDETTARKAVANATEKTKASETYAVSVKT